MDRPGAVPNGIVEVLFVPERGAGFVKEPGALPDSTAVVLFRPLSGVVIGPTGVIVGRGEPVRLPVPKVGVMPLEDNGKLPVAAPAVVLAV